MSEIIKKATRDGYGDMLVELGKKHTDFAVLDADLSASTKTATFGKVFPERHINCGIAEENMMGIAAGFAASGMKVFASSFAMFAVGRAYEIIRNSIGYTSLNVKIGASHAGVTVGEDGASHQCIEDLTLMRVIPGMTVLNPCDYEEAKSCVKAAYETDGPFYIRFGRLAIPVLEKQTNFELGKGIELVQGNDVAIIATGYMVHEALKAAEILSQDGIKARIINIHTIKPLDNDIVIKAAKECGAIVTAEEHSIIGGLGSAVTEAICELCPTPVLRIGVEDVFGISGPALELINHFKLDAKSIAEKANTAISLKK